MSDLISPNPKELEFLNGSYKKDEYMSFLKTKSFSENSIIVDVGANVGVFSLSIANYIGPLSKVYSIEPFKEPFLCLVENVKNISSIETVNAAIMTTNKVIKGTYLPNYTLLSGFYVDGTDKINLEKLSGKLLDEEFTMLTEDVNSIRLDTFLEDKNIDKIDILKIDVEKAEVDVLKSLGERISDVACIVAEAHEENLEEFTSILKQHFKSVIVSNKDLPKFCLQDKSLSTWSDDLNTYIIYAH
jgi:FkbM family methyltransferase